MANGNGSLAAGSQVQANGDFSSAFGFNSIAAGLASQAQGEYSNAFREGQNSLANGEFATQGDAQTSTLVLRGSTPGSSTFELVELQFGRFGDQFFTFEDDKAYIIDYEVLAFGLISGNAVAKTFAQVTCYYQRRGAIHFSGSGALSQFGDAAANPWTLTLTTTSGPTRVAFQFRTEATQAAVQVVARIVFTEVTIG